MTTEQEATLRKLCESYNVPFDPAHYPGSQFDLPPGYVAGWVGGPDHAALLHDDGRRVNVQGGSRRTTIYVGVSPEGAASS